jgi:hypothetical protein
MSSDVDDSESVDLTGHAPVDNCERCGRSPAMEPLQEADGDWLCLVCHDRVTNEPDLGSGGA